MYTKTSNDFIYGFPNDRYLKPLPVWENAVYYSFRLAKICQSCQGPKTSLIFFDGNAVYINQVS